MFRLIRWVFRLVIIIVVVVGGIGYFTNSSTLYAAKGYTKIAENALDNLKHTQNSSTDNEQINNNESNNNESNNNESNNNGNATQVRQLTKPYVVIGSGVDPQNINELKNTLGVDDNVTTLTATSSDLMKYINLDVPNSQIHSSVSIVPSAPNSGVNVTINDYNGVDNITMIKPVQYAMVATMAGLKNVSITVSSDIPIGGQGALGGIYVALAADGIPLSTENTEVANGMLNATTQAIKNSNDPNEYAQKLSGAILNASGKVADGTNTTTAINTAFENANIENSTSLVDKNLIIEQLNKFKNTPVAQSKGYSTYIKNTVNIMVNNKYTKYAENTFNKIKNNKSFFEKLKYSIENGFIQVVNWVKYTLNKMNINI